MHAHTTLLAVFAAATIAGCADKAEPDLKRCEELEARQKYQEAIEACQLARSKDPESSAGKKADAKLPVLEAAKKKREQAKAAAMEQERAKAEKELAKLKGDMSKRLDEIKKAQDCIEKADPGSAEMADCTKRLKALKNETSDVKDPLAGSTP